MAKADFVEFGFYNLEYDYIKYLHDNFDSEVHCDSSYANSVKPYIGIIVNISDYKYFIPLTSAKQKHTRLKNITKEHLLIYEIINCSEVHSGYITKPYDSKNVAHIMAMISIYKMIPVPDGCYKKVDFDDVPDDYRNLLQKEYLFVLSSKDKILERASAIYDKQISTGKVYWRHCNFLRCEEGLSEYVASK